MPYLTHVMENEMSPEFATAAVTTATRGGRAVGFHDYRFFHLLRRRLPRENESTVWNTVARSELEARRSRPFIHTWLIRAQFYLVLPCLTGAPRVLTIRNEELE